MKAQIPPDAPVLTERGSPCRPTEVTFEAKEPYSIAIVITNGPTRRKFIHINRRRSGIYIAPGFPGGYHASYHSDGKRHWKVREIDENTGEERDLVTDLGLGPPLDQLTGFVQLQNAATVVAGDFLNEFSEFNETDGPFDKIVYLDNRALPESINYEVILVEPFRHGLIPFIPDWPVHFQLFTRCLPWIALLIYEQWPNKKGNDQGSSNSPK